MMQKSENVRHKAYTVAIAFLLSRCIVLLSHNLHLVGIVKELFFAVFGITALVLGLFKFHKSLSFGLTIGGLFLLRVSVQGFNPRHIELLEFIVAVLALGFISVALYRLYQGQQGTVKKTKIKRKNNKTA